MCIKLEEFSVSRVILYQISSMLRGKRFIPMMILELLMCIIVCSSAATCAPADSENIENSTPFFDTRVNEVDGEVSNDEVTTTNVPEQTESIFDKRFDIEEDLIKETTSQPTPQMQIPLTTEDPIATTENSAMQAYQTYQNVLQQQMLRTFLMLLTEIRKRQMQAPAEQEVQESQVVETSMPCECEIDDVSTSDDDGNVIVFDENSGRYVSISKKLLNEDESHVSIIQRETRIESR